MIALCLKHKEVHRTQKSDLELELVLGVLTPQEQPLQNELQVLLQHICRHFCLELVLTRVSELCRCPATQGSSGALASQLIGKLVQQASKRHHAGADHVGRRPHQAAQHHLKQQRQAALV